EQEFERIGGKAVIKVDVRILAATNKNLLDEIEKSRFREDLFYRLNVVEVRVPPLRERMDDLMGLIKHFFSIFSKKYNKQQLCILDSAFQILMGYSWPGNVRELRNVVERAVVLSQGDVIEPQDFPIKLQQLPPKTTVNLTPERVLTMAEMERVYIRKILEFTGGNKLEAARLLDITPKTLRSKISGAEIRK
ncbi:sigma-54-dependent Fis family transcriptional regulator, partial [bacterium]|nr:sigma-54-dependent Fis family transcriptional regulator [bacterium]